MSAMNTRRKRSRNLVILVALAVLFGLFIDCQSADAGLKDRFKKDKKEDKLDKQADGVSGDEAPAAAGVYEGPKKAIAVAMLPTTMIRRTGQVGAVKSPSAPTYSPMRHAFST